MIISERQFFNDTKCYVCIHSSSPSINVLISNHVKKKTTDLYHGFYGKKIIFPCLLSVLQLQRAWKAMRWSEKLSLVLSIFRGIAFSSNMAVNKLKVSLFDQDTTISVILFLFSMLNLYLLYNDIKE